MRLSLRQRLLLYLLSATALIWLIVAAVSAVRTRAEVEAQFDARLVQSASIIRSLLSQELTEERALEGQGVPGHGSSGIQELQMHLAAQPDRSPIAFQLEGRERGFRILSTNAPSQPLSSALEGFANASVDGVDWRVYSTYDEAADVVIRTAENKQLRASVVSQVAWQLIGPLILALPLFAVVIWSCVGAALRPVDRVAQLVRRRQPARLDPLPEDEAPSEIAPLVGAINTLLGRLERALSAERQFTADAAHELRTPLTAIKTQMEIARRSDEDEMRARAVEQIGVAVERTIRLIEQLLTLARLEPGVDDVVLGPVSVHEVVRETAADLAAQALRKDITLELSARGDGWLDGNASALAVLVRNVLDNAVRYTPGPGIVEICSDGSDDERVVLTIDDSGPGVPADERDEIRRRFYRRPGTPAPGSGLGLSIVERIAALHDADLRLTASPLGGLQVVVVLPRRAANTAAAAAQIS